MLKTKRGVVDHEIFSERHYLRRVDLNNIIGVQEASTLWGISNETIIVLCEQMILKSKKIDGVWIIYKNQSLPEKY